MSTPSPSTLTSTARLRIGILGAARIAPMALIRPAAAVADVEVVAVAARDAERARAFARKHGIARVHATYQALIDDPDVDAVYNPLPNGLHGVWTTRALDAGKHVLCEKPMAANGDEAAMMAAAAVRTGRVLMEAFHWRHHPLAHRAVEVVKSGTLGTVTRVETRVCVPLPLPGDIRFNKRLAGGALMDTGCYAVNIARALGGDIEDVSSARAWLASSDVDRAAEADVRFAGGGAGNLRCSLLSSWLFSVGARVVGERGELRIFNPLLPQLAHRFTLTVDGRTSRERFPGEGTYTHQLRAFADACLRGGPVLTSADDGVRNMRAIDAIYAKAGLPRREPTPA